MHLLVSGYKLGKQHLMLGADTICQRSSPPLMPPERQRCPQQRGVYGEEDGFKSQPPPPIDALKAVVAQNWDASDVGGVICAVWRAKLVGHHCPKSVAQRVNCRTNGE